MCWWQQESYTGQLEQTPYEKGQPLKPTDTGSWCKRQDATPKREEEEGEKRKGKKGGSSHVFTVSQSLWPARWIRMIGPLPRKPGRWRDCQERKRVLLFSHSVVSDSLWPHGLQHSRLPFTISRSLLKFMSIESATPSSHLVLCHPLLLLPYEQTKPLWLSWLSLKISSVDDLRSPALNIRKRYSIFVSVTEFKKVLDVLFPLLYRYIFSWFFL